MRLGKSMLALLLVVEQRTHSEVGAVFIWEERLRYVDLDGTPSHFIMSGRDLRALDRLAALGLVRSDTPRSTTLWRITDAGRAELARRRAAVERCSRCGQRDTSTCCADAPPRRA